MAYASNQNESNKQIAIPNVKVVCDVCEPPTVALYYCGECDQKYCEVCEARHHRTETSRRHTVKLIENGVVTDRIKEYSCNKHKSYLFCGICNQILCSKCVKRIHHRHGIVALPKPAPNPTISQDVVNLLKRKLEYYERIMRQRSLDPDDEILRLQAKADHLKAEVDEVHHEAVIEMEQIEMENKKQLEEYKERINKKKEEYDQKLDEIQRNTELIEDDIELLEYSALAEKEIEEMYKPMEAMPVPRIFDHAKYENKFMAIKNRLATELAIGGITDVTENTKKTEA